MARLKSGKKFKRPGEVIGIDVPYEEPKSPDIVIESDKKTTKGSANEIFSRIKLRINQLSLS